MLSREQRTRLPLVTGEKHVGSHLCVPGCRVMREISHQNFISSLADILPRNGCNTRLMPWKLLEARLDASYCIFCFQVVVKGRRRPPITSTCSSIPGVDTSEGARRRSVGLRLELDVSFQATGVVGKCSWEEKGIVCFFVRLCFANLISSCLNFYFGYFRILHTFCRRVVVFGGYLGFGVI